MTLLAIKGLEVNYDMVRAVTAVELVVREGEIVALVGANGAGKSSTIRAICGIKRPRAGSITFCGQRLDHLPPHQIMGMGIAHVPEGRRIFSNMTLRENLLLGAHYRNDKDQVDQDIESDIKLFPSLGGRLDEHACSLSGGELQMLALLRGMIARPRLLILDEPSLGLAPRVVEGLFHILGSLRDRGLTILLVEQNIRQALTTADRGYVMESGRVLLSGKAPDLLADDKVVQVYLGTSRLGRDAN